MIWHDSPAVPRAAYLLLCRGQPVEGAAIAGQAVVIFVPDALSVCRAQGSGGQALREGGREDNEQEGAKAREYA